MILWWTTIRTNNNIIIKRKKHKYYYTKSNTELITKKFNLKGVLIHLLDCNWYLWQLYSQPLAQFISQLPLFSFIFLVTYCLFNIASALIYRDPNGPISSSTSLEIKSPPKGHDDINTPFWDTYDTINQLYLELGNCYVILFSINIRTK